MPTGEYLQYGGQAVIEGVMMRSPRYFAIACRNPQQEVVLLSEPIAATWIGRQKWLKRPFLRGTLALLDAMALGIRALQFSSNVQLAEPPKEGEEPKKPESIQGFAVGGAIVFAMAFGMFLFVGVPTMVSDLFRARHWSDSSLNMMDGVIRIAIFIAYIAVISILKDIRAVFQYHGAEHKAVNTLEANLPLTIENAKQQTRLHPRCGTSFIMVVLILSIILFSFLPRPALYLRMPMHMVALPIIAGLAYEAIRLAGRFKAKTLTKLAFAPGLLSQYLTTREPTDDQIEVALAALRTVVEKEHADAIVAPVA
jgi:uncharacterized protein YqhQ